MLESLSLRIAGEDVDGGADNTPGLLSGGRTDRGGNAVEDQFEAEGEFRVLLLLAGRRR